LKMIDLIFQLEGNMPTARVALAGFYIDKLKNLGMRTARKQQQTQQNVDSHTLIIRRYHSLLASCPSCQHRYW